MDWPKCEYCEGEKVLRQSMSCEQLGSVESSRYIPCPKCNGIGEAAELSADQAAELLPGCVKIMKWWYVRGNRYSYCVEWGPGVDAYRVGETLTIALSAAARAVYERGKE